MSEYLTASELAELIDCKPNQRAAMISWLNANRWSYVLSRSGLPRVLREYRNKKLGITHEQPKKPGLKAGPNLDAFRQPPRAGGRAAAL